MTIRGPTKEEIDGVLKLGSRGWDNQTKENTDFWFDSSAEGEVEGTLPLELQGTFLRNGPGWTTVYGTPLKHPIDGDGIVCALTFTNGRAHFRSKFVQTDSHRAEEKAQRMLYPGQMGSKPPPGGVKGQFRDPAHTNVFYWGGKILACHEYTLPNVLDPSTLETVGRSTLGDTLDIRALSAHFRYDPKDDLLALVAFKPGVELLKMKPKIRLYEYDRAWGLQRKTSVSLPGLNYAHDFLMTSDWYILHMTPFVDTSLASLKEIKKGKAPGELLRHYPGNPSKMVLVERRRGHNKGDEGAAPLKILQFDTEPCHIYHFGTCNQSADGGMIEFDACCAPPGFTMEWQHKSFLANVGDAPTTMKRYAVDLKKNTLKRHDIAALATTCCEFPTTNPFRHVVRPTDIANGVSPQRFMYIMCAREGIAMPFCDIVKYDVVTGTTARWHTEGVAGEPCFVARLGEASATHGDEDDGWVVVQVYLPGVHKTEFCVLDAKDIAAGPICRLKMRDHIPIGFHGTFTQHVFVHPEAKL